MTRSPSLAAADRKKMAWDVWANCDSVTTIFSAIPATPELRTVQESLPVLERFVVLVYDRTSEEEAVNGARKHPFTKMGRNIEAIPSTQAALVGHTKRAAHTSGPFWAQSTTSSTVLPSPADWGWTRKDDALEVYWTALPETTKICLQLFRCGCKKGCRGQCKCMKAALQCTVLCECAGQCWVYKGHD